MALAVAQSKVTLTAASTTTPTTVFTSNTTTGNLIIVGVAYVGVGEAVSSVSDTVGGGTANTYTKAISLSSQANGFDVDIWYCANATGGTTPTVTAHMGNADTNIVVGAYEVSGAATTSVADGTGQTGSGTGTSLPLTTSLTTTNANDILFAVCNQAQTGTAGPSGWTTETTFFSFAYDIVSTATTYPATFTQSPSGAYSSVAFAFKASAGATTVNATVAIAAKAVSGLTVLPQVTKDATFFCAAGAHGTFTCNLGAFGHAILQGKATSTSFNGRNTQLRGVAITPHATGTFTAKVTHNATVAILGNAGSSRFGPVAAPTIVNAIVHLFGFAANNTPINQFLGRAFLTLRAQVPIDQVSINGRATLTLSPLISRNMTFLARGTAKVTATGLVTGAGNVTATLVINGRAAFTTVNPFLTHDAQVVIQAGNPIFTLVEARLALMGHARMTLSPFITRATQVQIRGRATLAPNVTLGGTNNIFAGVHFAGTAAGTFFIPPLPLNAVATINGTATLTLPSTNIISLSATVAIRGRANAPFSAIVQGGIFQNGVLNIRGRAVVTASQFTLVQPTVQLAGLANMLLFPGGTLRAVLGIHGFAALTAQVAKQPLQWSSGNTIQYKVWQYNSEAMVRVFGSSWTATSVGLSFQSVALEVISTEAGWGS